MFKKILLIAAVLILAFTGFKSVDALCLPGFCLDLPVIDDLANKLFGSVIGSFASSTIVDSYLSVSPTTVKVGQPITIKITAGPNYYNYIISYILLASYQGGSHESGEVAPGTKHKWVLPNGESAVGTYNYCGQYKYFYITDIWYGPYATTPSCISVKVTCADECSSGESRCFGNFKQTCGKYDNDICLEWPSLSESYNCGTSTFCIEQSGVAECYPCSTGFKNCDENSSNQCETSLNTNSNCGDCGIFCNSGTQECNQEDGVYKCIDIVVPPLPSSVNIKANGSDGPITIPYNSSVSLSWIPSNTGSCSASDGWFGSKPTSGSETINDFTCYDVNGNGVISQQDALIISNTLYFMPESDRCIGGSKYDPKMDLNKDGCITANDGLLITNYLRTYSDQSSTTCSYLRQTYVITCIEGSASDSVTVNFSGFPSLPPSCQNESECNFDGLTRCYGNSLQTCGNYDSDTCLEWSLPESCQGDTFCGAEFCTDRQKPVWSCNSGQCEYECLPDSSCDEGCQHELDCTFLGQRRCLGNSTQICGDRNDDDCREWGDTQSCGSNQICQDGSCVNTGSNQCSPSGAVRCYDAKSRQICLDSNGDGWLEWSSSQSCASGQECQNGTCISTTPLPPTCTDECSARWLTECTSNTHFKVCGYNYIKDGCLHWYPPESCIKNTTCGYGTCTANQRPSWYCSSGGCLYNCLDDSTCEISDYEKYQRKDCYNDDLYWFDSNNEVQDMDKDCLEGCDTDNAMCIEDWIGSTEYCETQEHCGDGILNCEEDAYTCPEDAGPTELIISAFSKPSDSEEWKEVVNIKSQQGFDVLLLVINNSSEDFDNVMVQANLPDQIIYKQDLKIKDVSYGGDIREPFNIGFISSNSEKRITFKGEIVSNVNAGDELEIVGTVKIEDLTYSDSIKLIIEEGSAESESSFLKWLISKWYIWLLLWIVFIVFLYWIVKRSRSEVEEF